MIWPKSKPITSILGMMGSLLLCVMCFAEPVASTPPKVGDPISMTMNFTTTSGAIVACELHWDGQKWMLYAGGEEAPLLGNLPDTNDKRIKIFPTDWLCDCN